MSQNREMFFNHIDKLGLYNKRRFKLLLSNVFNGIDLNGKNVLDIGGGNGLFSFYTSIAGAASTTCLEPESSGSSENMQSGFSKLKYELGIKNVELVPSTFQEFMPKKKYDVVMLFNSINHLNEKACESFLTDSNSREKYRKLFAKIYDICNENAVIIITDCSRYNLFQLIKLRNPFVPTIEWHKHQSPEKWKNIMEGVGFVNTNIKWSTFNTLGNFGKFLLGNKYFAYLLMSHFYLQTHKLNKSK